jgi:hypothetical protein
MVSCGYSGTSVLGTTGNLAENPSALQAWLKSFRIGLLLLLLAGFIAGPPRAESPAGVSALAQIDDFVARAGSSVTAYDLAAHFNSGRQDRLSAPASVFQPSATFNDAGTYNISVTVLTTTKFVVAYTDGANSFYGTARVGEMIGGLITYGPETVFNPGNTQYISLEALSTTKVVIVYQDAGNSYYGTAVIGDVGSFKSITFGLEYVFCTDSTYFPSVGAVSVTGGKFVVAYQSVAGAVNKGKAVIGTTSGNVITFGSETIFNDDVTGFVSTGGFPWVGDQVVVAYRDNGDSGKGKAIIGDVSGYTITFGSEFQFNSTTGDAAVLPLSASKFVVAYRDTDSSDYGIAKIGDISGTNITFGAEKIFNTDPTYIYHGFGIAHMSDTRFVIGYTTANVEDEGEGRTIIGDVSGNNITWGSQMPINAGSYSGKPAVNGQFNIESFIVCWQDQSYANYGKCRFYGGSIIYMPLVRN